MLHELAAKITDRYVIRGKIDPEERDIYDYSFEILLSTVINLAVLIILSAATSTYVATLCFALGFMALRGAGGGYHARTHIGCLICLLVVYSGMVAVYKLVASAALQGTAVAMQTVTAAMTLALAPVDNENRVFSPAERRKFRMKTLIALAVLTAVTAGLALTAITGRYAFAIAYAQLAVALSFAAGKIANGAACKRPRVIDYIEEKDRSEN